ncbi:hypothetical protein KVT40_005271 [Elsinoe batatas]|uniref:Uncharacterized protein n=1 Tax=Elsinoe batatas TaxID=2601811 RepID=A0A8K0PE26_9PEZI|nr:hypothetical protein KVT40_005271 [Elsinoe batatas]
MTSGDRRGISVYLVTVWSRSNDNKPSLSSMLIALCFRPNRNGIAAKMSMTTSLYEAFDVLRVENS